MLDTSGRAGKARTCTGAAEPAPVRACGACGSLRRGERRSRAPDATLPPLPHRRYGFPSVRAGAAPVGGSARRRPGVRDPNAATTHTHGSGVTEGAGRAGGPRATSPERKDRRRRPGGGGAARASGERKEAAPGQAARAEIKRKVAAPQI